MHRVQPLYKIGGWPVWAKFPGIDLVWVCWLLVSDSGYNELKFALILKLILTNKL